MPAFLSSCGFLWFSVWGWLLLVAGLLHCFTIGAILGLPPSVRAYRKVGTLSLCGGGVLVVALSMLFVMMSNPHSYFEIDPFTAALWLGVLDDDGNTVRVPSDMQTVIIDGMRDNLRHPSMVFVLGLYSATFVFAIIVDVMTALCCYKCIGELQAAKGHVSYAEGAPTRPNPGASSTALSE